MIAQFSLLTWRNKCLPTFSFIRPNITNKRTTQCRENPQCSSFPKLCSNILHILIFNKIWHGILLSSSRVLFAMMTWLFLHNISNYGIPTTMMRWWYFMSLTHSSISVFSHQSNLTYYIHLPLTLNTEIWRNEMVLRMLEYESWLANVIRIENRIEFQ